MKDTIKVGFCGLGVVGQGVWKHLLLKQDSLSSRLGCTVVPWRAAVRNPGKSRVVDIPPERICLDPLEVAKDPDIDIVCELMGGIEMARQTTLAALEMGKIVVTANKALLSEHGDELFQAARRHGGWVLYEASVAGGIPIIKILREGLVANRFPRIYGILNGTCNYILTRMESEGLEYPVILAEAKRLGYAEAEEALDVEGWDTAHKASVLTYLAHGVWVSAKDMPVEGISRITQHDFDFAKAFGYKVKLIALILLDSDLHEVFVGVQPAMVPESNTLASVHDVYNAISVDGDVVGNTVYIGRGAGQDATASAVISDIADAVSILRRGEREQLAPHPNALECWGNEAPSPAPPEHVAGLYYIRLTVQDTPGVLAQVATVFAANDVSIASVLQREIRDSCDASLILTTHRTNEKAIRETRRQLGALPPVRENPLLLRIADFESR